MSLRAGFSTEADLFSEFYSVFGVLSMELTKRKAIVIYGRP